MKVKNKLQVYLVAINTTLGSFFFGYQLVNISCIARFFGNVFSYQQKDKQMRISIITAVLPFAAIIGALLIEPLMRLLQARKLMIFVDMISILLMILESYSLDFYSLVFTRFGLGIMVGINSGLVPKYIYSVTPRSIAGSICSLHQVMIMVGVATAYTMGLIIDPDNVKDQIYWRILFLLPVITCFIRAFILTFFLKYEIPTGKLSEKQIIRLERYYYKVYQNYDISFLRSSQSSASDLSSSEQNTFSKSQIQDSTSNKSILICMVLVCSNQFCGINAILFYAKQVFMHVTNGNLNLSQILIIILGVVQILAAVVGGKLNDKWNKKYSVIVGQFVMCGLLAGIYLFDNSQNIVILLIFLHSIAYNFSIGQLLMYFAAKMLENTGTAMILNWFLIFVVALNTEIIMGAVGVGRLCLVFCVLQVLCLLYLIPNLPADQQPRTNLNEPLKVAQQMQMSTKIQKIDKDISLVL